jgi:transcriptional regulator with XRE-family HTH domain
MPTNPQIKTLKAHRVAALVLDARLYARRTPQEACSLLGWEEEYLLALETAEITPSLPELEALAAIYAVPVDHFFGSTSLSDGMPKLRTETMQQRLELRNRILGAMIMQTRSRKNLSRDDIATMTGLTLEDVTAYELGLAPLPVTDLEEITRLLQIEVHDWIDSYAIPTREMVRPGKSIEPEPVEEPVHQPVQEAPVVSQSAPVAAAPIPTVPVVEAPVVPAPVETEPIPIMAAPVVPLPLSGETVDITQLDSLLGDSIPKELAAFISNPVNKQYLLLASNLSHMPADQLRHIAESLLEITF